MARPRCPRLDGDYRDGDDASLPAIPFDAAVIPLFPLSNWQIKILIKEDGAADSLGMKIQGEFFNDKGEKVVKWFEAGSEAVLKKQLAKKGWRVIRIRRVDKTRRESAPTAVGIVNFTWGFALIIVGLLTQFRLGSFALLGVLYFFAGVLLVDCDRTFLRLLSWGLFPASVISGVNLFLIPKEFLPDYFHPSMGLKMLILGIGVLFPLICNAGYYFYVKGRKVDEDKKPITELAM